MATSRAWAATAGTRLRCWRAWKNDADTVIVRRRYRCASEDAAQRRQHRRHGPLWQLTQDEARRWGGDFNSWEIVDTAADLFTQTSFWGDLVADFAEDERAFVRRTAFAMIAGATVHNKQEPDDSMLAYLPLIERHAEDPRNFVKKAVNWALRSIGKRSRACHGPALSLAEKLSASSDPTARWIGKDAVHELTSEKILSRLK